MKLKNLFNKKFKDDVYVIAEIGHNCIAFKV